MALMLYKPQPFMLSLCNATSCRIRWDFFRLLLRGSVQVDMAGCQLARTRIWPAVLLGRHFCFPAIGTRIDSSQQDIPLSTC